MSIAVGLFASSRCNAIQPFGDNSFGGARIMDLNQRVGSGSATTAGKKNHSRQVHIRTLSAHTYLYGAEFRKCVSGIFRPLFPDSFIPSLGRCRREGQGIHTTAEARFRASAHQHGTPSGSNFMFFIGAATHLSGNCAVSDLAFP